MIVLFSDFGHQGPYIGEMHAVLRSMVPEVPVIELMADAPQLDPQASAYLLAAACGRFPPQTVFLCVVDPGVGGDRAPGYLALDDRLYVGPDNGLFEILMRRSGSPAKWHEIVWRPAELSKSFHGRDLFAPVAARLARGLPVDVVAKYTNVIRRREWPDDLMRVVHIDRYGNAVTGIRFTSISSRDILIVGPHQITCAGTFSDVPPNQSFWYNNSNGLVEIAVNLGRADEMLGIAAGIAIQIAHV